MPSIAEADSFRAFGLAADVGYNLVASPDGRAYGTGLNRLKVLRGRLSDPARVDEAVADFTMPGARVGQRVRVRLMPSGGDTHIPDLSAGPVWATFTVVGIVAAPAQSLPSPPTATSADRTTTSLPRSTGRTAALIRTGLDFRLGGRVLWGFAFAPVKGTFAASMLAGRVPAAADEVRILAG